MDPEKLIVDDTVLCRLFWKNPLAFWRYHSYLDKMIEDINFRTKVKRRLRNGRKKLLIVLKIRLINCFH
ncbi:hypothetical protein D3C72_2294320 [compost metagenome]